MTAFRIRYLGCFLAMSTSAPAAAGEADLHLCIEQLRSDHGVIQLCLMNDSRNFPACDRSPGAIRHTLRIGGKPSFCVDLKGIRPGNYALALFQDENRNQRLDTLMAIPREGFGFSGNPRIRFGPPSFERVKITIAPGANRQTIKMQYMLGG